MVQGVTVGLGYVETAAITKVAMTMTSVVAEMAISAFPVPYLITLTVMVTLVSSS